MDTILKKIEIARKRLFQLHHNANVGHLGPSLSILDALMTLFNSVMDKDDRFILSKGHAASALYIALWSLGLITEKQLDTFCKDGTYLPAHPHGGLPLSLFPTGSLGHGPSLACGLALAAKRLRTKRRIWCFCGDGEWEEGACWESLIFAAHHRLDNLTIAIDCNGLQGFGSTVEVASLEDYSSRLQGFGASIYTVDGHNPEAIADTLRMREIGMPTIILLKTIKGRGLSNQGTVSCHYLPLSDEEFLKLLGQNSGD